MFEEQKWIKLLAFSKNMSKYVTRNLCELTVTGFAYYLRQLISSDVGVIL